jgi:hypothetical protein
VASLGDNETDMVEPAHQGLKVVEPTPTSNHHEVDRSRPGGKLRHGEADEKSTDVQDPTQRCLDLLQQTLGDELLFRSQLVPRDRFGGRHRLADGMNCQERGNGAPTAAMSVVDNHRDDVIDEDVSLVGAVRDGDMDGLGKRLSEGNSVRDGLRRRDEVPERGVRSPGPRSRRELSRC